MASPTLKGLLRTPTLRWTVTVCAIALVGLLTSTPAAADSFGGRAFSAFVYAPTLGVGPLYLSDTGTLSPTGGWEGAGQLSAQVSGVLSAAVLNAATSGTSGQATSSSSLADIVIFGGQLAQLTASFVQAQVHAGIGGAVGTVQIYNLTFGGTAVTVTGLPNQRVDLPGVATLIINEQAVGADGNSITVNALRLTLATGEQVVLASAASLVNPTADVQLASAIIGAWESARPISAPGACGPAPQTTATTLAFPRPRLSLLHPEGEEVCLDFVTGGGFFEPPHSTRPGRVNFGFNAGPRSVQNPDIKGHLNLIDHGSGDHLKGINVDLYEVFGGDPEHCRMFEGDATFNGIPGYRYRAGVCDYGEPGRDDRFQVRVTTNGTEVYFADNFDDTETPFRGELDGGNIQLHTNPNKCFMEASAPSGSRPAPPRLTPISFRHLTSL